MTDTCLFFAIAAGDVPSVQVAETHSTYPFMDINRLGRPRAAVHHYSERTDPERHAAA